MLRRLGLAPFIAAAALAVAGCDAGTDDGAANDANAAETNAAETNAVEGNAAQSNVATAQGLPAGGTCGGIGNEMCAAATDFCKLPTGQCDVPDAQGTCTTRPEICTKEYRPVCGCDGKTYGNACEADAAGVSVQAQGECPKAG